MSFFITPKKLKSKGILGLNRRNLKFVADWNSRSDYPKADDKILTKELAQAEGISVPKKYLELQYTAELRTSLPCLIKYDSFVIKPARGSGGEGVLVINECRDGLFIRGNGEKMTLSDLVFHSATIIHGLYSLGGKPDRVLVEEKVEFDPIFDGLTVSGIPDIRLIVFNGTPVMAMLRLPTKASNDRANLHQGAVGVGIDIKTGVTTHGVCKDRSIDKHPDTLKELKGLQLPQWESLLNIAKKCYKFSNLGYLGVDIVYDRLRGPLLLEINARPGLAIQIANNKGLLPELERLIKRS